MALNLPVEHGLCGGIMGDLFIGQDGHQPLLQGAKAAFDFAFGLGAGGDQMGDSEGGEGALELRAWIAVIGHGVMTEEAEAVRVHHHGQAVLEKEAAEMLEMIPSGVGGDEDRAQEFAGMVVHGEQQGLLVLGGPPLVDRGIVLPKLVQARAFPASPGFGAWFWLTEEFWKVGPGISGHGLPVAFEAQAGFQFIGYQLEIRRFLKGEELLEEGNGLWWPVRPMVAAGELGRELGTVLQPPGAEPVEVGAADLEMAGGISNVNGSFVKLLEDLLEKEVGEAFGDLLFDSHKSTQPPSLGRGLSSAFATLRPPQALDQGTVFPT